jgi:hypothetical protein
LALGLSISLAKPTGIHDQGWLSRPASSTSTLFRGSALSRLASTEPAEPAPTTMKSKLCWSIFPPAVCIVTSAAPKVSAALRRASSGSREHCIVKHLQDPILGARGKTTW